MEQLWAPWRLSYVAAAKHPSSDDPCFICRGLAEQDDRRNLIEYRLSGGHIRVGGRSRQAGDWLKNCQFVFPGRGGKREQVLRKGVRQSSGPRFRSGRAF